MVSSAVANPTSFYMPFHSPYPDDHPQSSEDGSGIHSPSYVEPEDPRSRNILRAPPSDLDLHSVGNLLSHQGYPSHQAHTQHSTQSPYGNVGMNFQNAHSPPEPSAGLHPMANYGQQPSPSNRMFETERRFARSSLGHLEGGTSMQAPSSMYYSERIPSNNRGLSRIDTDVRPSSGAPSTRPMHAMASPLSAVTPDGIPSALNSGRSPLLDSLDSNPGSAGSLYSHSRREPSLVVIACRQCRARKIKCDSTRPSCNNCIRRQNTCQYDLVPKRRGPDKRPGTRQRSCKKRTQAEGASAAKKKQKKSPASGNPASASAASMSDPGSGLSPSSATEMGSLRRQVDMSIGSNFSPRPKSEEQDIAFSPGGLYHSPGSSGDNRLSPPGMGGLHMPQDTRTNVPPLSPSVHPSLRTPHAGLRLDMNFTEASNGHGHHDSYSRLANSASTYSGQPSSSLHSQPRTASDSNQSPSMQSLPRMSSAGGMVSPTTAISIPTFSPMSDYRMHKSTSRDDLFAKHGNPPNSADSDFGLASASPLLARSLSTSQYTSNHTRYRSNTNDTLSSSSISYPFNTPSLDSIMLLENSDRNTGMGNSLWWDNLLHNYCDSQIQSESNIMDDLCSLFRSSIYWLSFLNERHFFRRLRDSIQRERMQPSLVIGALALSVLLESSELGRGEEGREKALMLRDMAHTYLTTAWNSGSTDPSLAHAAMLIAVFEMSAHPHHSDVREEDALLTLDEIIKTLALTALDSAEPGHCRFSPNTVPVVRLHPDDRDITLGDRCFCPAPSPNSPSDHARLGPGEWNPTWSTRVEWDPNLSRSEIEREEIRRMCWCALSLAAAHTSQCAALHKPSLDLFIGRPENYALLFPGEKHASSTYASSPSSEASSNPFTLSSPTSMSPSHSSLHTPPKQSIRALYCRSMLLWNSVQRVHKLDADNNTNTDKAEFVTSAWLEAADIQDALEAHSCHTDEHLMNMTREHVFNTRIAVSYELRRLQNIDTGLQPNFSRAQAEEWIKYQCETADRFSFTARATHNPTSMQVLARRPFYVWWFMNQLEIAMSLWRYDNTLNEALVLGKAFLVPLDILSAIWPCADQRKKYIVQRNSLAELCSKAGVAPPEQPDISHFLQSATQRSFENIYRVKPII